MMTETKRQALYASVEIDTSLARQSPPHHIHRKKCTDNID
jgi:hypothetical protein